MTETNEHTRLIELEQSPIRAPSAAAAKSVAADLKPLGADHPEIAALLSAKRLRAISPGGPGAVALSSGSRAVRSGAL
jgi:hypothetical protein